jgi:hypothetical protein
MSSDYSPLPLPPSASIVPDDPVIVSATAPTNLKRGIAWYDTGTNSLKIWDGAAWQTAGGGGGAALPAANAQGQFLISGTAPGFNWSPGLIDSGRY